MNNTYSAPRHTIKYVDLKEYFLKTAPMGLFLIGKPSTLVAKQKDKSYFLHQYRWEIWEARVIYDRWK